MLSIPAHPLKLLVVGGGGREHALCWKLAQSLLVEQIYCAPGNGGTAQEYKTTNLNIDSHDFPKLARFCQEEHIDFIVVGPDNPLAEGIVDYFLKDKHRIFGPRKAAARLEWSKVYAKEFMGRNNLPTARFKTSTNYNDAIQIAEREPWARVVKADGLAFGKGVYVCNNQDEVKGALKEIFEQKRFGRAGEAVVLEEKLHGEEISLFLLCDGKHFLPLAASQDNKRRFDNDCGPNTGGMGAISPPAIYERYEEAIKKTICDPLLSALQKEDINYQGVLYLGLILDQNEDTGLIQPKIIEFNSRFGDPETQAVLPRLESDLLPALWACTEGKLAEIELEWKKEACCCVVAVTNDYPDKSASGQPISFTRTKDGTEYHNDDNDNQHNKVVVFHAGTKLVDNKLVTAGGRVFAATALSLDLQTAANLVYNYLAHCYFEGLDYRKDIAKKHIVSVKSRLL